MGRATRHKRERAAKPAPAGPVARSRAWPLGALCAVLTVIAYWPALSNGFVSWDDPEVLLDNLQLRRLDGASLRWMWSSFHTGNWIPLTWLSHALVYRAARLDPWAHHAASVALHAINTGLVFVLARTLFERARDSGLASLAPARANAAAAITALLFGLHPLHVESVAWVAERKDVLYAFFFLLALLAFLARPERAALRRWPVWLTALFFLLALLSKPMAVTLPLVLLILELWPLGRLPQSWRPALLEKAPLFALAAGSAVVTLLAQSSGGALVAAEHLPASFRVMNACHSLAFYLWKMLLPLDLLPLYPIDRAAPEAFAAPYLMAAAFVLGLSTLVLRRGTGRGAPFLAAWAYYVVTLLPVLGLVQVGGQLAADRYTYLPSLAPFLVVASLLAARPAGLAIAALALLALVPLTRRQIATWHDSVTLWERVVAAYPDVSSIAHTNLGNAYHAARRDEPAVREFRRALAIGPPHAYIENGLGTALLDLGRTDDAVAAFERALALDPLHAPAHRNLWFAWNAQGDPRRARAAAEAAVRIDPGYADAWSSLGISQGRAGELAAAEASFRRALALDPDNPDFLTNLEVALQQKAASP